MSCIETSHETHPGGSPIFVYATTEWPPTSGGAMHVFVRETDCERIAVNNEDLEQEIRDLSGTFQGW